MSFPSCQSPQNVTDPMLTTAHFHRLGHLALRLTRGIDMRELAIAFPLRYDMASFAIFRSATGDGYK